MQSAAKQLTAFLDKQSDALRAAIQKRMPLDFVLSTFMTAVRAQPKLMQCSPSSLLGCILQSVQLDLRLDPTLGEAWMVPFQNKKTGRMESQFIPGYRGYIKRIYKVPNVAKVDAALVYEHDVFEYETGTKSFLRHVPNVFGDRGRVLGAYSVVVLDNGHTIANVMSVEKLDKIRSVSKAKGAGPWVEWLDEMRIKSTFTGLNKKIPNLTRELNDMMTLQDKAVAGQAQEIHIESIDTSTGELPAPAPIENAEEEQVSDDSKNEVAGFQDAIANAANTEELRKILSLVDSKLSEKKISAEQRNALLESIGKREDALSGKTTPAEKPKTDEPKKEEVVDLSTFDPKTEKLGFGKKFTEKTWEECPTDYLDWVSKNTNFDDTKRAKAKLVIESRANVNPA